MYAHHAGDTGGTAFLPMPAADSRAGWAEDEWAFSGGAGTHRGTQKLKQGFLCNLWSLLDLKFWDPGVVIAQQQSWEQENSRAWPVPGMLPAQGLSFPLMCRNREELSLESLLPQGPLSWFSVPAVYKGKLLLLSLSQWVPDTNRGAKQPVFQPSCSATLTLSLNALFFKNHRELSPFLCSFPSLLIQQKAGTQDSST